MSTTEGSPPVDLIIVGAGLVGSYAARAARAAGLTVTVIDSMEPKRASPCAAGLYCSAWLAKYGAAAKLGMSELALYAPRRLEFAAEGGAVELYCVSPEFVLVAPDLVARVESVLLERYIDRSLVAVKTVDSASGPARILKARAIYLAAGAFLPKIEGFLPPELVRVSGKAGSVYLFEEPTPIPLLWRWAPYRQALRFERPRQSGREFPRTYFSDGTAILERNYNENLHDAATLRRAAQMGLTRDAALRLHGLRPYREGGPLFARLAPPLTFEPKPVWFGCGTEKAGTVLGAAWARMLVDELAQEGVRR